MERTTLNKAGIYSVVNQLDFENPSVQTHFRTIFHREIPPRQLFFQMFLLLRNKHLSVSETGSLTQSLTFCHPPSHLIMLIELKVKSVCLLVPVLSQVVSGLHYYIGSQYCLPLIQTLIHTVFIPLP